jgi:ubiquinone/menaquinone biosynthesis C-methylase UbiE
MEGYDASTYGDGFADVYDDWYRDLGDPEATANAVGALAGDRPVLELGVGTGRLALALVERSHRVVGVDASTAMLRRLAHRAHQTSTIVAVHADMSVLPLAPRTFGVVLAAYNTLFNLGDRRGLEHCFREARRVLFPGGAFVVETFVPPPGRSVRSGVDVRRIAIDHVVLTASRLDPHDQTISGQHIEIAETGIRLRPWFLHYAHPKELDVIADEAGFELEQRWGSWDRTPFDDTAHDMQIAVYRGRAGP